MFRTLDLEALTIAAADPDAAAETFRKSFGFEVRRETKGEGAALGIGPAELEMFRAGSEAPGLHAIVLVVDDLDAAAAELRRRGHSPESGRHGDRPALLLGPEGTHGARITLVAK